ncbi:MAG TPA: 3-hydroxyacyl-CoA dehydrogenase NAD-binding domain-containing protein [Polyangiaceae bacterium]|nr:3-hydroxyacyl-CoA dehydrogenase NAD-binding domain-containing protein [Polyangiaceae bacterium]
MSTEQPAIQCVAVIGAGQMGAGIAQVAARAGLTVSLSDQAEAQATRAVATMEARLRRQETDGKLPAGAASELLGRIRTGGALFGVPEADIIIEAAPEQLELKIALFRSLSAQAKPSAILASNTSSLSITRLARETARPEQVIGMHFMNPVPVMKLVEVVRGTLTSDVTLASVLELSKRFGKQSIVSQDRPGFLVNRILIPLLNEACFALEEGVGTQEDIDAGARLGLGHPLGPLELADLIGLDTVLSIAEILHRDFGDPKYRPCALLRNLVQAGLLGRKTGRGFYVYDQSGAKVPRTHETDVKKS